MFDNRIALSACKRIGVFLNKFIIITMCLCSVIFPITAVYASNIEHVNVGRVIVEDQSLSTQQIAGKKALEQVFVKLSGNQNVRDAEAISKAIDNFEQFLTASSFLQNGDQLIFEATFNRQKVENLLMASGLSVWASLRPSGMLWLGYENTVSQQQVLFQNQAYNPNTKLSLSQIVDLHAYARGVEIILPIGDFTDTSSVSVYDVWNQFISHILEHSQRYNADYLISATMQPYTYENHEAYLADQAELQNNYETYLRNKVSDTQDVAGLTNGEIGNIDTSQNVDNSSIEDVSDNDTTTSLAMDMSEASTESNSVNINTNIPKDTAYKVDYVITNRTKVHTGTLYTNSDSSAITGLIDVYANMLSKQFALSRSNEGQNTLAVSLVVNNVRSLDDYVSVIQLINSIPAISNATLKEQYKNQSVISIQQTISINQLRSILSLDPRVRISQVGNDTNTVQLMWQE